MNSTYQILNWFIFEYQKSLKSAFKIWYSCKSFEFVEICGKNGIKFCGKLNKNVMSQLIYPNYFGVVGY